MRVVLAVKRGRASAGDLLQRAQRRLQGDGHSVADGLRVVRHRVTGALARPERSHEMKISYFVWSCYNKGGLMPRHVLPQGLVTVWSQPWKVSPNERIN